MPRQLLRDSHVVIDDWQYLIEPAGDAPGSNPTTVSAATDGAPATPPAAADRTAVATATAGLIIPFDLWLSERDKWSVHPGRLGVVLLPAHKVEALAPDLARFQLVAAEFPGPSDGRGYTQGRLLRERYQFSGELRATGYVRHDQLFFLARCGFNSFQLAENELAAATSAFTTFTAEYQPSNDAGLPVKLQRR
jgi:uncharacterized protein (DUF934 family)